MNLKNILWVRNTGKILPDAPIGDNLFGMKLGGGGVITTATGNPVSIVTNKAQNAINTILSYSPKQSGSGDPSPQNIRPIDGWTEVNLGVNSETPTKTISLGGTYYGFTVDLENGTAEITHALVDLGTLTWQYSGELFYSTTPPYFNRNGLADLSHIGNKCDCYDYNIVTTSNPVDNRVYITNSKEIPVIRVSDSRFTNPEDLKTYLSGHYIAFVLQTHQTITLTPQTVALLKGNNTLWTDGDEISITYKAKK